MTPETTPPPAATPEKPLVKHTGERTANVTRLVPQSFAELVTLANTLAKSDIVPKEMIGKPANVLLALMFGNEVGLTPAQSLQNIMVVNGRPSMWGDAVMGLCIAADSVYEDSRDEFDEKTQTATFRAKRKGKDWVVRTFSMADAKVAGLASKAGPWQQYPKRMLFHRARSWALRDTFPDILKGIRYFEEERDIINTQATTGADGGKVYEVPPMHKAATPEAAAPAPAAESVVDAAAPNPAPEAPAADALEWVNGFVEHVKKETLGEKPVRVAKLRDDGHQYTFDAEHDHVAEAAVKLTKEGQGVRFGFLTVNKRQWVEAVEVAA